MSFIKQIAEIADILGIVNLGQNLKQNQELKTLKTILNNEAIIMRKLDELEKKLEDIYNANIDKSSDSSL